MADSSNNQPFSPIKKQNTMDRQSEAYSGSDSFKEDNELLPNFQTS